MKDGRTRLAKKPARAVDSDTGAVLAARSTPTARLLSGVARGALLLPAVLCERAFPHLLDRGGMRRIWLRDATTSPSATWSTSPATSWAS